MIHLIGWLSSFILVLTIAQQIRKQWSAGTSKGVSKWLFIGQLAASAGFTVYSIGLRNWVFATTNGLMALAAITGLVILLRHRASERA